MRVFGSHRIVSRNIWFYASNGIPWWFLSPTRKQIPSCSTFIYICTQPYLLYTQLYLLYTQPYLLYTQPYLLYTQPYLLYTQPYLLYTQPYLLYTQPYLLYTQPYLLLYLSSYSGLANLQVCLAMLDPSNLAPVSDT